MNAQEKIKRQSDVRIKWGKYYRLFRYGIFKDENRHVMRECRREAALERKLEAAQRKIETMTQDANKFSMQHYYGVECDPQVDPQDWYEFDLAFGIAPIISPKDSESNDHSDPGGYFEARNTERMV